jgi:hypothetical protein
MEHPPDQPDPQPQPALPAETSEDGGRKTSSFDQDISDIDWGWERAHDEQKSVIWEYLTPGRWRACRAVLLLYVVETAFPADQHWMYYFIEVILQRDFATNPKVFLGCIASAAVLWLFPVIPPTPFYSLTILLDIALNAETLEDVGRWERHRISVPVYLTSFWILRSFAVDPTPLIRILEPCLGPVHSWSAALVPALPGLLLGQDRNSINGFIPEGKQGIVIALLCRLCSRSLPSWLQWCLYLGFSMPDWHERLMFGECALASAGWIYLDVHPTVAYLLFLLSNQFHGANGGAASVILRRERSGSLWFGATLLALRECDVLLPPGAVEPGVLAILLVLLVAGYRSLLRMPYLKWLLSPLFQASTPEFVYQPLKDPDGIRIDPDGVRLLRLLPQPTRSGFPVHCELLHANIASLPNFIAVSHCWGRPKPEEMEEIIINGWSHKVSPSIHSLLLSKRSALRTVVVWIDSICINQKDDAEKSRQVGLHMRHIFESAAHTIGWLGDHPDAKEIFDNIRSLIQTKEKPSTMGFALRPLQYLKQLPSKVQSIIWKKEKSAADDLNPRPFQYLEPLLSNPWFERVWIVQELATSRELILRYGKEELNWNTFASSAFGLSFAASIYRLPQDKSWDSNGLVNALTMENIRAHIEDVEYLKLKDMLKLGLRFKSTLPIDKVYGLLGIVEERNGPFLRPNLDLNGSLGVAGMRVGHVTSDIISQVRLFTELMEKVPESRRSGRARTVLEAMTTKDRAQRTVLNMTYDFKVLLDNLVRIREQLKAKHAGDPVDDDVLAVDYSTNSTAGQIYTYVAKDLLRNDDVYCVLRFAGIKKKRDPGLKDLPSWVPDWSRDLDRYILPRPLLPQPGQPKNSKDADARRSICVGGARILLVRGKVIGRIEHQVELTGEIYPDGEPATEDSRDSKIKVQDSSKDATEEKQNSVLPGHSLDALQRAEKDYERETRKYWDALQATLDHPEVKKRYKTFKEAEDALWLTTMANTAPSGRPAGPADIATQRSNILGFRRDVHMPAALDPAHEVWAAIPGAEDPERKLEIRVAMCERYLSSRRLQRSGNSIFAHLVRVEILPSFETYRWHFKTRLDGGEEYFSAFRGVQRQEPNPGQELESKTDGTSTRKKRGLDLLADLDKGPFAGFADLVDYTIGRKFAILHTGFLGLVPGEAEVGDTAVWLENENMVVLVRKDQNEPESKVGTDVGRQADSEGSMSQISGRLVGESYIHDFGAKKQTDEDLEEVEFKLW